MRIYSAEHKIDENLDDPKIWTNPYPLYQKLRELDGLAHCVQFGREARILTRYKDINAMLRDTQLFKNDPRNATGERSFFDRFYIPKVVKAFARSMIFVDDLDHRRLRSLASKAFTPARVDEMQSHIKDITESLLHEAAQQKTFDLMSAFALPLPLQIISEMLGVNEQERRHFHSMINAIFHVTTGRDFVKNMPKFFGLYRFFKRLLKRKRRHPEDDLTSALIKAEEDGDRLTPEELMGTVFLLLFAGHETTVNLIGNGTLALLENPEQYEQLKADHSLVPSAIEEMLRYYSPAQMIQIRHVAEPCHLGGVDLAKGDMLVPMVGSANRDRTIFENPDAFEIQRKPNKHLAFGVGVHFCIGAQLSRVEGRIALTAMLEKFKHIQLAVDPDSLKWRAGQGGLRGLQSLPVQVS